MNRMLAGLALASAAALMAATPAQAAITQAPAKPVTAVKKQLVPGKGVTFTERTTLDSGRMRAVFVRSSGTYQFSRGVQTGGAGPSVLANWSVTNALIAPVLGHNWTGVASKSIGLMREGQDYGKQNLSQLDLRASKRFRVGKYRLRGDFDLFNVFNSNWPYTVNTTFSTATTSQWLRPTNVLQARFFKIGAQIDF